MFKSSYWLLEPFLGSWNRFLGNRFLVKGGVIVLDRQGNVTACYNADQMTWATITRGGKVTVTIVEKKPGK